MNIDCSGQTAAVVINGRTAMAVEAALDTLRTAAPALQARGVVANLSDAQGCATLIEAVPGPDILINNVGIYGAKDFFAISDGEWQQFFEINVMSGVRLSRAYLPGMLERNRGRIVFISSESALNIPADMLHYAFTKTAQLAIARGPMPHASKAGASTHSPRNSCARSGPVPSLRAATAEEVANMVVYVASPLASATNGAALRVDGGVIDTVA